MLPRNPVVFRGWMAVGLLFATGLVAGLPPRGGSSLSQEPGAVYLEGLLDKRVYLHVTKPAPVYYQLDRRRLAGTLLPNQKVVVLAVTEQLYRVRGKARHAQVAGWVPIAYLTSTEKDFVAKIKKLYERQLLVQEMIRKREVALGMTMDEVLSSIGKPSKRSSKLTAKAKDDTWEYVTYDRVPHREIRYDQYGRPFQSITYLKIPVGKLAIQFTGEVVASIEEVEGDPIPGAIKIVPGPVFLW